MVEIQGCAAMPSTGGLSTDMALPEAAEARWQDVLGRSLQTEGEGLWKRGVEGWEGAWHDAAAGTSFCWLDFSHVSSRRA